MRERELGQFVEYRGQKIPRQMYESTCNGLVESKEIRKMEYEIYKGYICGSELWKVKREEVFQKRGRQCEVCGSCENIQVHHNNYARLLVEDAGVDVMVLCYTCHQRLHEKKPAGDMNRGDLTTKRKVIRDLYDTGLVVKGRFVKSKTQISKVLEIVKSRINEESRTLRPSCQACGEHPYEYPERFTKLGLRLRSRSLRLHERISSGGIKFSLCDACDEVLKK